jgi:Secretion system C-terminal sorting domain
VKSLNIFTNFEQGVRSLDSKENQTYLIEGNNFSSNYFFSTTNAELNNKGTAIYLAATASIVPDKLKISLNTISQSRQGIFVTKFNPKYSLSGDVLENHAEGCEIVSNTITLSSLAGYDFLHKAIILIENQHLDVVNNTLGTIASNFNALSPATKKDKYFGIEMNTLTNGSDIFDNNFTTLGKMISVINGNPATQLRCNYFDLTGSNNYQGDGVLTGITGIEFVGTTGLIDAQGGTSATANNSWNNFNTLPVHKRVRRTTTLLVSPIPYYYNTTPVPDIYNPFTGVFEPSPIAQTTCIDYLGMVANPNDGHGNQSNTDLAKDGEEPTDSLLIANYETVYDSTAAVADLYADAYYLQLAIEAAALGIIDSTSAFSNFQNSVVYDVYLLETAIANGDSASIATAATNMPHDDMGTNYAFVATLLASVAEWSAEDSAKLWSIAFERVDDGGPAVIIARNMYGIYLDDLTLPSKSNKSAKTISPGILLTIAPNPNAGNFTLTTNMPLQSAIKIVNAQGQLVYEGKLNKPIEELRLYNLQNGLYHLYISDSIGKLKSISFVISK